MADETVGTSTSILEHSSSTEWAGAAEAHEPGPPRERGRLRIVVHGGPRGRVYQSLCSAPFGERLSLDAPIDHPGSDPDRSCSS